MIISKNPRIEVKGFMVFRDGEPLKTSIYRVRDFPHLYNDKESTRVVFSYTPLKVNEEYVYGILVITPSKGNELHRFSCHKSREEGAMHVWGESHISTFEYLGNGGVVVKEAKPNHWDNYRLNGYLSIWNKDYVNSVWLLKTRGALTNTDEFKKHGGEPILYKRNEKLRNYNYLVWKQELLEKSRENILKELLDLLRE